MLEFELKFIYGLLITWAQTVRIGRISVMAFLNVLTHSPGEIGRNPGNLNAF